MKRMSSNASAEPGAKAARNLSGLQRRVVSLCALVALLDGFDTQAIGPAAKAMAGDLHVPMAAFGPVFSASQVGFLLGALVFGALGDRLGRKRLLIAATTVFALCSLGTAFSPSLPALIAFRFIAGLGLGGASPNFVSLASEYSPPARRAGIVTMLWAAVPLGGMTAAFASAWLLQAAGWRAVFQIGFAAPLLLALALARLLPESHELGIAADSGVGTGGARASSTAQIRELFSQGRALATGWLWLASFMTWTALIVMAFWTPPLLQRAGLTAAHAAELLALNNAGGVVGTLVLGAILTRVRPHFALAGALALAAALLALVGVSLGDPAVLAAALTGAGFFASAAAGALLAVSAETYPADARATGVGWALGFGRVGAVVGPMAAGLLVARGWPAGEIYFAIAAPFALAAVLIVLLAGATRRQPQDASSSGVRHVH